jgi:hypothetical protein
MSKRLTSLLVGAFAVLMLGTTAQAQAVMKRENPVKDLTAYCQKLTLKVNLASNPEFQKLDPRQQERVLLDVQEKKAGAKLTLNARPFNGAKASKRNASPSRLMAPRNAEETYLGIIVEPAEGVHNFYTRAGMSYIVYNQQVYYSEQSGYAEVVECEDGTVYVKDLVTYYNTGAWVKGTKEGNTITIPSAQPVNYNTSYETTLSVFWGVIDGNNVVKADGDFVFQIDGDVISLQDSSEEKFVTVFWDDDDSWTGYADWESVWTLDPEYGSIVTGDDVDTLPYVNTFETEEEQAAFGILDGNNDSNTWGFTAGLVFYGYNENAADEWLVSPGIYLEAGKIYHFAIDVMARSSWYPERIEVLMGTAAKVDALTEQVIEPTDVDWTEWAVLENEDLVVSESGYYNFGVHAISDGDAYNLYVDNFKVELGAQPTAPAAVTDLCVESFQSEEIGATIKFTAPTTAINGEPLAENLAKIELYRDGAVIETFTDVAPGAEIVYEDKDAALTLGAHTYMVLAYNADGYGKKSEIVEVTLSVLLSVPYFADFSGADSFNAFLVLDANEDGNTWSAGSGYAATTYNQLEDADDYLVTMPIQLKANTNYTFKTDLMSASTLYPERFEVVVGTEPTIEGLTTTIIPATDLVAGGLEHYEGTFTVEADGLYYVAIHDISDADMYAIYLYNFSIEQEFTPASPKAPRISVQPDPYGLDKAVVTVTAPDKSIDGTKLAANLQKLVVYRNGMSYKVFEDCKPGDIKVFVDEVAGSNTYMAVAFDAEGNHGQASPKVGAFIGLDTPATPENIEAVELAESVKLTWDAVTTGANGGVIVPEDVTYTVYSAHQEFIIFDYMWVLDEAVATTTETSIIMPLDNSVEQTTMAYFIGASNEAGEGETSGVLFFVGQPYEMPVVEHFGQEFNIGWLYNGTENVGIAYSPESSDEDGSAIVYTSENGDDSGYFLSGKIAVQEGNPTLLVDVMGEGAAKNRFIVKVVDASGNVSTLTGVPVTPDFKTVKVSLADFATEPFIKVMLYCDLKGAGSITFDNCRVMDLYEYNLVASLKAEKSVKAGEVTKVNVAVQNQGERGAKDFTVKVFAGDKELLNEKVTEELASFGIKEYEVDYATTIFDDGGDVKLRAEVEYDLDLDEEDNVAESVINVKQSTAAQPVDVAAQKSGSNVTLTWSAPTSAGSKEVTEDFEDGLNGWTTIDSDGDGYNWAHFANVEGQTGYSAHSGASGVNSASYVNNVGALHPDNWLISPLAVLNGTFSFWAVGQDANYAAEHFAVFVSTTSATDLSTFVKVSDEFVATGEYKEYSVDLSSYAGQEGWIAIRHYNVTDMFYLVVDDITFLTAGGGSVTKYNVYVDRELYDDTTATSMEIKNTTAKSFAVSAVYSDGQESKPVEVILSSANQELTAIEQLTGSKQPVDVYSLDGKLVRQQATSLQGLKGAYIINNVKVVLK